MAMEFAKNNLGRVKLPPYILDSKMKIPMSGLHSHQMGTTRMAAAPNNGVVNPDCKVFGTANLFVPGSSGFRWRRSGPTWEEDRGRNGSGLLASTPVLAEVAGSSSGLSFASS